MAPVEFDEPFVPMGPGAKFCVFKMLRFFKIILLYEMKSKFICGESLRDS